MSYFGSEKRLLMSVSTLHSSTDTQSIDTNLVTVSIFNNGTLTPRVSSIGYPTISVSNDIFTLEAGYKYLIDCRFKVSDSSPSANEAISYYLADLASNQISSTGVLNITNDSSAALGQERCLAYINAISETQSFVIKMQKNFGSTVILNYTIDFDTINFRPYLLIKAWK